MKRVNATLLLLTLAFAAGLLLGSPNAPVAGLNCLAPLAVLGGLALLTALGGLYYGKQKLDARARVWRARAAQEEALAAHQQARLHDLTPGPDGRELARLVQTPDGRVLLVRPDIATAAVTEVAAESAVRPDRGPDHLQLAAILSAARLGPGPADLLLAAGLARPTLEERLPAGVRVLSAEEARLLEDGRPKE